MPELPEVETTKRGLAPHLEGQVLTRLEIRDGRLRYPVEPSLVDHLAGARIERLARRSKVLLIHTDRGLICSHLGMSGSWRLAQPDEALRKHDHLVLHLSSGAQARYHDPRRFGWFDWSYSESDAKHLQGLGPEPLTEAFTGRHLFNASRGRNIQVKPFIMTNSIVVGVGNIYATEALFAAGIHPGRAAGRVSLKRYEVLAAEIKTVLARAIEQGGSTLRDFVNSSGEPGYFAQQLSCYGRAGEPCVTCGKALSQKVLGQRASVFCTGCQR